MVEEFLRDHDDFAPASASEILKGWGIGLEQDSLYLTLWPHRTGTDGFFAAVMHRWRTGTPQAVELHSLFP